jgi:hypothetical protein
LGKCKVDEMHRWVMRKWVVVVMLKRNDLKYLMY